MTQSVRRQYGNRIFEAKLVEVGDVPKKVYSQNGHFNVLRYEFVIVLIASLFSLSSHKFACISMQHLILFPNLSGRVQLVIKGIPK